MATDAHHLSNIKLKFLADPEAITKGAKELISVVRSRYDVVAALKEEERTYDNTLAELDDIMRSSSISGNSLTFVAMVSPDKAVRDAASAAEIELDAFDIDMAMRDDLYQAVLQYQRKGEALEPESQYFLERMISDFERNGLKLSWEQREKIKEIKKIISEKGTKFNQSLSECTDSRTFTREELAGMPDDFFDGLKKDGDKFVVSLKYPELLPVLKKCTVESTRKTMEFANSSKCQDVNTPLLEDILRLRVEAAALLGYETHSHFVLERRMAKNPATVLKFISELSEKLTPLAEEEYTRLVALKAAHKKSMGEESDGVLNAWDFSFYNTKLLESEYQVDDNEIKNYFPLDRVTEGLLSIYQEILHYTFTEVPAGSFPTWHEDVKLFAVSDSDTKAFVGHFYLDLHPREGKYGHAAVWGLQQGCLTREGRQTPVAAMVCNFTKPTADRPSLLKHDEVVTFFHEFGHVCHNLASAVKHYMFAGTSTQRDFVEAPSQMLENWCYEKEVVARLSAHYERRSDRLPDALLQRLVDAKNVNAGLLNKRQLFFGSFDMTVHSAKGAVNTEELWGKLRKEITMIEHTPGTNPAAGFGHIVGGYDSGYYGYLWSEVFSADMFEAFKSSGRVINPDLGLHYRNTIISRGGSVDASVLLRDFLGREPTQDAFLKSLGLKA